MRKKAPLMFAGGLLMVFLQIVTAYALILGMNAPACVSNSQCTMPRSTLVCVPHPGTEDFYDLHTENARKKGRGGFG